LESEASPPGSPVAKPKWHFFHNVLWSWAAVAATLIIGFILTPIIIRKLGAEGYGIWTTLYSLVSYYGLLDLGLRSAVVYFSGQYRAQGEPERINQVINTVGTYYSLSSLLIVISIYFAAGPIANSLDISAGHRPQVRLLLIITSMSWMVSQPVFNATLEGFQRFDLTSRIVIGTSLLRGVSSLVVLALGGGLVALSATYLAIQTIGGVASYLAVRHMFPQLALAARFVRVSMLKTMLRYSVHTVIAYLGLQTLQNAAVLIIGWRLSPTLAGYYSLPLRLLQQSGEMIARVGSVSSSRAIELITHGKTSSVLRLAILSNRYCCALFAPVSVFLFIYGTELIQRWVGGLYVQNSAPLLPILAAGTLLGYAGQFNSSTLLFSLARHDTYARALLVEVALHLTALALLLPRYGLIGAACASAVPLILVRGIYIAWPLCRALDSNPVTYLASVFAAPLATAVPVAGVVYFIKTHGLPGANLPQLFAAAALCAILYFPIALFTSFDEEHRERVLNAARLLWRRLAPSPTG
jgi:O-antigen/teichoic acid export membrane protein